MNYLHFCSMRFILFINLILMFNQGWTQSPQYWEKQGDEAVTMGNWPEAFEAYRQSFELDSTVFDRRIKWAQSSYEMREDALAIRLFQSAIKLDQGKIFPESYYYLSKLNQRNGRYDEVVFYVKKFKQRAKVKKDLKPLLEESDLLMASAQWALNQVAVDSIQWKSFSHNSEKGEGQPYWQKDSLCYLSWNEDGWKMMKTDTSTVKLTEITNFWEGNPVFHIVDYEGGQWAVGKSSSDQLVLLNRIQKQGAWIKHTKLNQASGNNTMPHIGVWNGVTYLIFVSDRIGGKGGQDLWLSRYTDKEWSEPFPAGAINTAWDEVEPRFIQGELYFSSNGFLGFGEFDLFKVSGKPGAWGVPENLGLPINSCKNDIGFDILKTKVGERWVLGSARNANGCCQDIFEYQWNRECTDVTNIDSIPTDIKRIEQWLPLKLYFHNDEPNPNSWDTLTQWTFTQCQISYLDKEPIYIQQFNGDYAALEDWESFKDVELVKTYNRLQAVLVILENRLLLGDTITLVVRGFASPLADGKYNQYLTSRRIGTLKNEIKMFRNASLVPYIDKTLLIRSIPYGESTSKKVSDDKKNQKQSVYSSSARSERRIEIEAIEWKKH